MILVDTSAWASHLRGHPGALADRVAQLIEAREAFVTEPVLMEVLAGARDEVEWQRLRRLMRTQRWVPTLPSADFEGAAQVFAACRTAGITPGGYVDCIIASIALRVGATLLTGDEGFVRMATVLPLQVEDIG